MKVFARNLLLSLITFIVLFYFSTKSPVFGDDCGAGYYCGTKTYNVSFGCNVKSLSPPICNTISRSFSTGCPESGCKIHVPTSYCAGNCTTKNGWKTISCCVKEGGGGDGGGGGQCKVYGPQWLGAERLSATSAKFSWFYEANRAVYKQTIRIAEITDDDAEWEAWYGLCPNCLLNKEIDRSAREYTTNILSPGRLYAVLIVNENPDDPTCWATPKGIRYLSCCELYPNPFYATTPGETVQVQTMISVQPAYLKNIDFRDASERFGSSGLCHSIKRGGCWIEGPGDPDKCCTPWKPEGDGCLNQPCSFPVSCLNIRHYP